MSVQTLIRQAVRARIERARTREHVRPNVQVTLTHALRRFDARLPVEQRPVETALRCYRIVNGDGTQCNEPLYRWPTGHTFCYMHGPMTR